MADAKGESKLNQTGAPDGLSYNSIMQYLKFVFKAHNEQDITHDELFRQFGKTPYPTHCLLAAQLLLSDQRVPWKERKLGYLALLLHDIKENTAAELPDWVDPQVKKLVNELALDRSNNDATTEQQVLNKPDSIKLLILVDMLSNLYEEHVKLQHRKIWIAGMKKLMHILESEYGKTRVFTIARALIADTDWSGHHG